MVLYDGDRAVGADVLDYKADDLVAHADGGRRRGVYTSGQREQLGPKLADGGWPRLQVTRPNEKRADSPPLLTG